MRFLVAVDSHDLVEVEARSKEAARSLVEERGADEFASVWFESEVVAVRRATARSQPEMA